MNFLDPRDTITVTLDGYIAKASPLYTGFKWKIYAAPPQGPHAEITIVAQTAAGAELAARAFLLDLKAGRYPTSKKEKAKPNQGYFAGVLHEAENQSSGARDPKGF